MKEVDRSCRIGCVSVCGIDNPDCLGRTSARTLAQWPHKRGLPPLPDLRGQNPKYRDACVPLSSGLDFGILLARIAFFFSISS